MRLLGSRKTPKVPRSPSARVDVQRLLTEYVLHMSLTSLANEDITPLYEEYVGDPRLGELEREELSEAYRTLHVSFGAAGGV